MPKLIMSGAAAALLALTALPATAATAPTVNKTWVSSTGTDSGSCQLVAPCKTFAYAISETNAGGEIDVKDSGAYGAFTIDKAITIIAAGVVASVGIGASNNGIEVTAPSGDTVTLTGLTINTHDLSKGAGVQITCSCVVVLDHDNIQGNAEGLTASYQTNVLLTNCIVSGNNNGILANGIMYLDQTKIVGNSTGVTANGYVYSYHNNVISENKVMDLSQGSTLLAVTFK